ncbi:MAG TPA: SprT family zinc-dependent metalloprotease [Rhizomicrobium sp.]|nr:SprT family zinc-dependent metalloprotease [Rhizomicrobium sp.]
MAAKRSRSGKARRIRRQLVERALMRLDGERIPITLRLNPRARRLIVKVHPSTGEVTVTAPSRQGLEHAMEFARSEKDWIARRLAHVPPPVVLELGARVPYRGEMAIIRRGEGRRGPVWIDREGEEPVIRVTGETGHIPRRVLDFLKREARKSLDARVTCYAERLGTKPRRITVRDTASRWGSCSSGRSLSFSWRLIMAPTFVLDYVVAHEMTHLREMNHGRRFWTLLSELVEDVRRPQRWLNQHGSTLHRFAPK